MPRLLRLGFRIVSYGALGLLACGVACVAFVNASGVCPRFDEGAIQCAAPVYESIGGIGLMIVLVCVFTIVPLLLALAGVAFLVRDVVAWVGGRRGAG